jgi:hypothetical protein
MASYERRSSSSVTIQSNSTGTAVISCTAGKKVFSGGYTVTSYDANYPDVGTVVFNGATADDTWTVTIYNLGWNYGMPIQITAKAICM